LLDIADLRVILQNEKEHSEVFIRSFKDCPVYTEDIKSSKSINRMILPEGKVPRFCMGSVETEGPDSVAPHEHPMLDQLFFGLKGCRCTCTADGESQLLTENMLLHIPLGSKHSVSVADGEKLAYIWFDFFLTIEGQKYMDEQHRLEEE
jgi:quercetin dioxygenase-like cupin family protein